MNALSKVGRSIKGFGRRTGFKLKAKSPEILLVVGGITFVATVVAACIQTVKHSEEVLDEHERRMLEIDNSLEIANEEIEEVSENGESNEAAKEETSYSLEEAKKDRFLAYCSTALGFGKVYAPVIILGAVSLTCFLASYNIMRKRNIALTIAYGACEKAFRDYRERVRGELGDEADRHFKYGYEKKIGRIAKTNEDGTVDVVSEELSVLHPEEDDENGVIRDSNGNLRFVFSPETSRFFQPSESLNDVTIAAARNLSQLDLDCDHFICLNQVLKRLGIDPIGEGQFIGWVKGFGDPYIDFRTEKVYRPAPLDPRLNPYGAEYECIYYFDFNHCGTIHDKISKI